MAQLIHFKSRTKHNGVEYRQNARVSLPDPTAARLVALGVAEVAQGAKVSPGFGEMVQVFRSARATRRPSAAEARVIRARAVEEYDRVFRRSNGVEVAARIL